MSSIATKTTLTDVLKKWSTLRYNHRIAQMRFTNGTASELIAMGRFLGTINKLLYSRLNITHFDDDLVLNMEPILVNGEATDPKSLYANILAKQDQIGMEHALPVRDIINHYHASTQVLYRDLPFTILRDLVSPWDNAQLPHKHVRHVRVGKHTYAFFLGTHHVVYIQQALDTKSTGDMDVVVICLRGLIDSYLSGTTMHPSSLILPRFSVIAVDDNQQTVGSNYESDAVKMYKPFPHTWYKLNSKKVIRKGRSTIQDIAIPKQFINHPEITLTNENWQRLTEALTFY